MSWLSERSIFARDSDEPFDAYQSVIYSVSPSTLGDNTMKPAVNIYENDGSWVIHAEFPGVKKEDMRVKVSQKHITISAESKFDQQYPEDNLRYQECYAGTFSRRLPLPDNIDHENIGAKFENGILEVTIPKDPKHIKYNRLIVVD